MNGEPLDLEDLILLIRKAWPERYARGRILHVHRNAIRLGNGALVHLRVLVQQISEAEQEHNTTHAEDY